MFSYEHLASFCATVEEGSYSQAAKKLNKDRTTIREQIKALEDSYAVDLFEIQGKKAVATEEGEAVYRQAKLLVRNSEQLHTRMMDSYKTEHTHFDIYHDILVPNQLILHLEQYISQAFPHIQVNWLHRNRDEIIERICTEKSALAIMQNRLVNSPEKAYDYINLGTDELSVYCRPTHPLTELTQVTIGDLELAKQYISENHYYTMPEVFHVSANRRLISNNDVLIKLLQHDGWAILSNSLVEPFVQAGKLTALPIKEMTNTLKIGLSFYYPLTLKNSKELDGIVKTLKSYARENLT
ncbi:LysR family transcriptional regulator [Vibrio atypicus]|uniref:LysR family transcriptional regulator n=1 Tax=Vibrio atypicus TaxID=558271 RepID=UPI0037359898